MDYPPRPVEIELSNSRTLPSLSGSATAQWELQPHGYGEMSTYSSSSLPRQLHIDTPGRGTSQAPILQWYTENDGPWVPKGVIPEGRNPKPKASNGIPMHYGNNYRQTTSSDVGAYSFEGAHSDSGYGSHGARHSEGNASIFSADVADRDPDSQSLMSHNTDFQSYQGMNDMLQTREIPRSEPWNTLPSHLDTTPALICPGCHKSVKTKSELK